MFTEPLKLTDGTAWIHFTCYLNLFPTLREVGNGSICINHSGVDRGMQALQPLIDQHHGSVQASHTRGLLEWEQIQIKLTTWNLETQCRCHDAHKSMEWALVRWLGDQQITKDASPSLAASATATSSCAPI